MSKFANRLIELRTEKGFSQNELAKKLNISSITISRWERGTRLPNIDSLEMLANFFNVTAGQLLGIEEL